MCKKQKKKKKKQATEQKKISGLSFVCGTFVGR
jgi:hypothetical protein